MAASGEADAVSHCGALRPVALWSLAQPAGHGRLGPLGAGAWRHRVLSPAKSEALLQQFGAIVVVSAARRDHGPVFPLRPELCDFHTTPWRPLMPRHALSSLPCLPLLLAVVPAYSASPQDAQGQG